MSSFGDAVDSVQQRLLDEVERKQVPHAEP